MSERGHLDAVLPELYDQLRRLAERALARDRPGHTLQPTALVHEVYLRLAERRQGALDEPAYVMAAAAGVIRKVLVDHARRNTADKRHGGRVRVALTPGLMVTSGTELDMLVLHEALERLARLDARQAEVVELRFFGGLTEDETARVLDVARPTVTRDWRAARAWLSNWLQDGASS